MLVGPGRQKDKDEEYHIRRGGDLLIKAAFTSLRDSNIGIVEEGGNRTLIRLGNVVQDDKKLQKLLAAMDTAEAAVQQKFLDVLADGQWHGLNEMCGPDPLDNLQWFLSGSVGEEFGPIARGLLVEGAIDALVADGRCEARTAKDGSQNFRR